MASGAQISDLSVRALFIAALAAGLLLRMSLLTADMSDEVIKGWTYVAAVHGVPRLYDWAAAPENPDLRVIDGHNARGDYPPLVPYELAAAGRAYRWVMGGTFPDTRTLTAVVKIPPLLAEAALTFFLFTFLRHRIGVGGARRAALALWLNPAMIIATAMFGYLDAPAALPLTIALAAVFAQPALAGALFMAAVMTKPQVIVVAPALALAAWNLNSSGGSRLRRAAAGAAIAAVLILAPIAAAGALRNMTLAVGNLVVGKDMLANAFNLWWIVGHVLTAMQGSADLATALAGPAAIVPISTFMMFEPPEVRVLVRVLGSALAIGAICWATWAARRAGDVYLVAAAGAFCIHAYVVLATQVHENHLFAAIPLLALAAAGRPALLRVLIVLSAIFALNLSLPYGLSGAGIWYTLPRMWFFIDATLLVAAANCAALAWHAVVLRRSCHLQIWEVRSSGY